MIKDISIIFLIVAIVTVSGCATTQTLSPMQARTITTKQMEGSYENIYRACLTTLQDNGYIIKNTDMNSGLITATVDRETSHASQVMQVLLARVIWDKGTLVEVSVMVNKINDNASDVRINIQETRYNQFGAKKHIKQIYDEELYYKLFNTIFTEVKRREAMKR